MGRTGLCLPEQKQPLGRLGVQEGWRLVSRHKGSLWEAQVDSEAKSEKTQNPEHFCHQSHHHHPNIITGFLCFKTTLIAIETPTPSLRTTPVLSLLQPSPSSNKSKFNRWGRRGGGGWGGGWGRGGRGQRGGAKQEREKISESVL